MSSKFFRQRAFASLCALLVGLTTASGAGAQVDERRNFDARPSTTPQAQSALAPTLRAAADDLRQRIPDLAVSYSARTGVTRTLSNRSGYLTGTDAGAPLDTAVDYVSSQVDVLGRATTDLSDYEVRTVHESSSSGATRIYLRQTAQGLPLYNGELQVNVSRDGQIISVNNGYLIERFRHFILNNNL